MTVPDRLSWVTRLRQNGIWWSLLALLALAPIPFGANRPWAWSAASLWVFILLGAWAVAHGLGRQPLAWRRALVVPLSIMLLLLGWIIVSIIPGVGPPNPVWELASEQLGTVLPGRIALSVDAALVALMRLLAYLSIFWISLQYARDRDRAEALVAWLSWSGLVFALYGLVNYFAGNPYLLWFERWTGQTDVTSTFVNRNHYATFAGLGLLCAAGVGIIAFRSAWRQSDRSQAALARGIECLAGRPLVYFLIMLVIGMAWLQTHSRMGAGAVSLGIVVMLVLMMATGVVRRHIVQWVIALLLAFFLFQVSGDITLQRIGDAHEIDRLPLFAIISDQIASAPYTGSGYGSFSQAFLMYRDLRLPINAYTTAHNSYLELATEIGVPATIGFLFAISWCVGLCVIGAFRRRRDRLYPILAVAATFVVGVHALLDFSVQIPAVAMLYAAMLGMGVAQSWSGDD